MCYSRVWNSETNNLQEQALGITLGNTDIYWVKVKNGLSPKIMKEIWDFQENETSIVKRGNNLSQRNMQTIQYVIESISNLGAKIWKMKN